MHAQRRAFILCWWRHFILPSRAERARPAAQSTPGIITCFLEIDVTAMEAVPLRNSFDALSSTGKKRHLRGLEA